MPEEENSSVAFKSGHIEQALDGDTKRSRNSSILQNKGGRSLAWLGHQVPNLTTRVQIPVTAHKRHGASKLIFDKG